ncbi:MAG: spore coat associated protein CotJA [Oscillospiraceae bacterium]|jgi:hypothetical protein
MNETVPNAPTAEDCVPLETPIEDVKLARAYVPVQVRCAVFTPSVSLRKGTVFPPLWNNCFIRMGGIVDD